MARASTAAADKSAESKPPGKSAKSKYVAARTAVIDRVPHLQGEPLSDDVRESQLENLIRSGFVMTGAQYARLADEQAATADDDGDK